MWDSLLKNARSQPLFDWKIQLPDVDVRQFMAKYLNPSPGKAVRLRCPDSAGCPEDCRYRTVRELSSGLQACCPRDVTRARIPVDAEDVGLFRLNYDRFHKALADALGVEFSGVNLDDAFFWELGYVKTGTGRRMPVYLSYYINKENFGRQLKSRLREDEKFVLLAGKLADVPGELIAAMEREKCLCLGLDGSVTIGRDAGLTADAETVNFLQTLRSAGKPAEFDRYMCAPGTKWEDVHIRRKDGDTVSIWVKGEAPMQVSYIQLGMCNRVKGCRSKAFDVLLMFLACHGKTVPLPARGDQEYDCWKQRKKEICKALRKFFPNIDDGDPVEYVKNEGYRTRFAARDDESAPSAYHPARI